MARLVPRRPMVEKRQSKSCNGSGSWAKQAVLKDSVVEACLYLSQFPSSFLPSLPGANEDYVEDTALGQTRVYERPGFNSAGNPMTIHYTKQRNINEGDQLSECVNAEIWLIDNCHGNNQDSRGGFVTWSNGNRYGVDPQTHNCNC
ncbi:predicted protein [Chaetomium globosum CBS 148.51]|uniref:Uncharacterized protein n=1 Tax=Chaetomium globosum (strain ATCC 6205 / CBS 148.51 / DSM 1962 / NBRC 6347 / NRRL 1970) TaxID=306901 RepID=Q2H7S0_CHAGB|nr:uncharacterized protein CHGG_05295 [Chaetomium globosum CBS 148.51]EAQ88676.1 predicted protein [Chaetomium globosum CBS 148.51]